MSHSLRFPFLALIAIFFLLTVAPNFFCKQDREPSLAIYASPSWNHLCGTDLHGRDLCYRLLKGGQISLLVGCCGALITLFIGAFYGMIAGYFGGFIDALLSRLIDIFYSIPRLIFVLIFIHLFNDRLQKIASTLQWPQLIHSSRIIILIFSLGLIEWLTMARVVRGQTLSLKERSFITASEVLGQTRFKILWRHILPNLTRILLLYTMIAIPSVIIDEAFLSFLGLGIQSPQSSLGSLLAEGAAALNPLHTAWWLLFCPALLLLILLTTLYQLGNRLR